jgi:hypothetical protein
MPNAKLSLKSWIVWTGVVFICADVFVIQGMTTEHTCEICRFHASDYENYCIFECDNMWFGTISHTSQYHIQLDSNLH